MNAMGQRDDTKVEPTVTPFPTLVTPKARYHSARQDKPTHSLKFASWCYHLTTIRAGRTHDSIDSFTVLKGRAYRMWEPSVVIRR